MACAFYEGFSDLALFAASPAALLWALLVLVHQKERQRDQERWAGWVLRPQHDIAATRGCGCATRMIWPTASPMSPRSEPEIVKR
jgi:hypothetical protein